MALNIHQKISLAFATAIFVFSMYDVLFHLLLGIVHVLFASTEHFLDLVVDHLFDMGSHETQIIVFYLLVSIIGGSLYKLYRLLPRWRDKFKQKLQQHKIETLAQWRGLSVLGKIAWWSFFITVINCWLFLT